MAGLSGTKTAASGSSDSFENVFLSTESVSFPFFVFTCSVICDSSNFESARHQLHDVNLIIRHIVEIEGPGKWCLGEVIATVIQGLGFAFVPC